MPLDSHSTALLTQLAALGMPPLHQMTPQEARDLTDRMRVPPVAQTQMHAVENFDLVRPDGHVHVRLLQPVPEPDGVIVYYHGGGWVLGNIDGFDDLGRELAKRSSCSVLLVDYRLAPEYPFPTPVEDAWHALEWAAEKFVHAPGRALPLIVAGDSAGGNLAAVMALRARDRAGPALALQVLIYPVTDADFERSSYLHQDNQLLLSADSMRWFWGHYAPQSAQRLHPDAAPLRADSLAGLPPTILMTAEFDPLRDEGEAYAARLARSGVPLQFSRKSGQMHGFFTMYPALPASEAAIEEVANAVRRCVTR